jgi:hypothetical protein
MINATHQRRYGEKNIYEEIHGLSGGTESDAERITRNLHAAKVTKGSF